MSELAPIVLFLYNRPEHSKRTLDALARNPESVNSTLIVYCDGAKSTADQAQLNKISEVRKIARAENRFKEVKVIEQFENKGLSNSILTGVTEVLKTYSSVIVLEDDLLVSRDFLRFMNLSLQKYEHSSEVVCITGYVYPIKKKLEKAFFLKGADCWTWATWRNKWSILNTNAVELKNELVSRNLIKEFNFNNSYPYMQMLEDKINEKNNSWAILWYASAFLKNKYCLYPPHSLVQNIGNDGSGTHFTSAINLFEVSLKEKTEFVFPEKIEDDKVARKQFELFFASGIPSIYSRLKGKLKRVIKRVFVNQIVYGWSGDYKKWDDAKKKCSGYDDKLIVEKVKQAVLKVKLGEAKMERDSVTFNELYLFPPIVNALKDSVSNGKLHVTDFGGSLGSSYFQFKDELKEVTELKWTVVEQEHFVEIGKKDIAFENLRFEKSIGDTLSVQEPQLLLLFSVLQYISTAHQLINDLLKYKYDYILIDRTAFIQRPMDRISLQIVPPDIYEASYPCWFFNEEKFLNLFLSEYVILNEFVDEIPEPMMLGNERVYWKGFYLKRKND